MKINTVEQESSCTLLHRNYKFRLYPNKTQKNLLENHFFTSNQAWNYALNSKIYELKEQSELLKEDKKLKFNSDVDQDEMRKLDSIFKRFYSKQSEYNCSKITIEDLKIKKMKESDSKYLNKLIPDVSWNSLITKLKYKAEMHNTIIREINHVLSSQRCH